MFMVFSSFAMADQTQQYNKLLLTPFYTASMNANTNYSFIVGISPPDTLSSISSAILTFDAYINPTRTFFVWANGKPCNTANYTVSTSFASAGKASLPFDCTNAITQGLNTIKIQVQGGGIGASTSWLDLTYTNNPKAKIEVKGTEYSPSSSAKVWLQLLNSSGDDISSAICYTDIYTPAGSIYIERATMTNMVHDGIYYYNLNAPTTDGVYPVIATCYYTALQVQYFAQNKTIVVGGAETNDYTNTFTVDTNYHDLVETLNGTDRHVNLIYNFTATSCKNVSEILLTGGTISWTGVWDSNVLADSLKFSIFNYSSDKWILLSNVMSSTTTTPQTVTNSLAFTNITKAGIISNASKIAITINDTSTADGTNSKVRTDQIFFSCDQLGSPIWQQVKGASELHVTNPIISPDFTIITECGNSLTTCADMRYDTSYWNESQGFVHENLTVYNTYNRSVNSLYDYETPRGMDCTSIIQIERANNITIDYYNQTTLSSGSKENCILTIPIIMNDTESVFNLLLTFDNYLRWEVERAEQLSRLYNEQITPYCNNISAQLNYTYEIPLHQNASGITNNTLLFCQRAMDDLYWIEKYYNDSKDVTQVGEYESYLDEARYYLEQIYRDFKSLPIGQTGSISSITASDIWSYNNRTLTFYPNATIIFNGTINASVNITEVTNTITGLAVFDQNATLVAGRCPTTTGASLTLGFFILLALLLMWIAFKWKVGALGIFGSIILIVLSWYVSPCAVILGYICVFTGLVMLIVFAIKSAKGG